MCICANIVFHKMSTPSIPSELLIQNRRSLTPEGMLFTIKVVKVRTVKLNKRNCFHGNGRKDLQEDIAMGLDRGVPKRWTCPPQLSQGGSYSYAKKNVKQAGYTFEIQFHSKSTHCFRGGDVPAPRARRIFLGECCSCLGILENLGRFTTNKSGFVLYLRQGIEMTMFIDNFGTK